MSQAPLHIGVVHPSLGLGGAERVAVDSACVLQDLGHRVTIFTADFDPARSFPEARDGRLRIHVHGQSLPAQIGGRLRAPCNIVRTSVAALAALRSQPPVDVVLCSLLSYIVPLLHLGRPAVVYYCHFPDLLLTPPRYPLYQLYRTPLDRIEEWATGKADQVLVNSRFSGEVFRETFTSLRHVTPQVLYPGVRCPASAAPMKVGDSDAIVLFSINRFDPKKNLPLAIDALARLRDLVSASLFARVRLVLAGSYDEQLAEQRQLMDHLRQLAATHGLSEQVELRTSISDGDRDRLLSDCRAVLYTPDREHFGLVPIEAMAAARPVVAVDSGGPRETIQHGVTGFLCPPTAAAFAAALANLVNDAGAAAEMGLAARRHALANFDLPVFGTQLDAIVRKAARLHRTAH